MRYVRVLFAVLSCCVFPLGGGGPVGAWAQSENPPRPTGEFVDLGARRLHVNRGGLGSPTVVVENGAGGFSLDWSLVQPEVAKFAQIVTYDRAGYAWSDPGPTQDTVAQTVGDLRLVLRTLGIKPPFVLVGQSIGGVFVRAFQRRFPEEVAGLVLVDPTADEGLSFEVNGVPRALSMMSAKELQAVRPTAPQNPPPRGRGPLKAPYDKIPQDLQPARRWAAEMFLSDLDFSPRSRVTLESWREEIIALRRLRLERPHLLGDLPLVVLTRDRDTDESVLQLHTKLAALSSVGRLVVAEKSSHEIHLWRPDLVVAAIREVVRAARDRSAEINRP